MLTFAAILAPATLDDFFARHWEQAPLIIQGREPDRYAGLLSMADIDHIVSATGLRHPDFRLAKDGATLPLEQYTRSNSRGEAVADVDKLLAAYRAGATVILESLHERWKPLADLCRDLEQHLTHHVQANTYLTPRSAQGFAPHYDTHDVFVLQLHGRKHWRIYDSLVRLPDSSLPHHVDRAALGPPRYELDVAPGDLIYLPRGFVHEALTSDEESLHITVGIIAYSWYDVFAEVLSACRRQDDRFREALPPGFVQHPAADTATRERFRELAAALASDAAVDTALEKIAARFVASRRPLLDGALSQVGAAEAITLDSTVRRRTNIIFRLVRNGDRVTLSFYGKKVELPDYVEASLRYVTQAAQFRVCEIPGEIDDAARVVLVRSLAREGFLIVDG